MGILDRIKRRLPIVGGAPAPAASRPSTVTMAPTRAPEPEPSSPRGATPVREWIESQVVGAPVVLFMKGSPSAPQCGFSATAAGILAEYGKPLAHVDVLQDPDVREDVKAFTSWPTIPQIFIGGEFVGGADILRELHQSGELRRLVEAAWRPVPDDDADQA
jgi:monothiol glutaredoxin